MNRKKAFLLIVVLIGIMGTIFGFTQKRIAIENVEFIEKALSPIKVTKQNDKKKIKNLLNNTFYQGNFIEYGMGENDSSQYSLEKIMYTYCLIKKFNISYERDPELQRMLKSLEREYQEGELGAIDELAYIVLKDVTSIQRGEENIKKYVHKHIDEKTGLLFETSEDDDYTDKISFTVEVIKICKEADIELEAGILKNAIYEFMQNYDFLSPDEGQTLFNSGGLPIYAVYMIDEDYDFSEYRSWYTKWKMENQERELDNWDTYLDVYSSFLPVAEAFHDEKELKEDIGSFLTSQNIKAFVETNYDETFAFNFFINEVEQLDNESQLLLFNISKETLDYYVKKLQKPTLKSNYYGIELAYATDYGYDEIQFHKNCNEIYMDTVNSFIEDKNKVDIRRFIEDTYYYLLIRFTCDSLERNRDTINEEYIQKSILNCMNLISESAFNDPTYLRMFCESMSYLNMEITNELKSYLKEYLENCKSNTHIINSKYIGDLFIMDQILGTNVISVDMMKKSMYNLSIDGSFKFELEDQNADIDTTFLMYAIIMNYGLLNSGNHEMKILNGHIIDFSTLERCCVTSCLQYMN